MANFRGHITTSAVLGITYSAVGVYYVPASYGGALDWGPVILAGGLTTLGGMLPDLDSDHSVPIHEMTSLSAAVAPFLILPRIDQAHVSPERFIVLLAGIYLFVRYGIAEIFKRITVHRGMFHSIPAMLIAGLIIYLLPLGSRPFIRLYLGGGVMLGFLSHLILDEICSVDLMGMSPRLKSSAGSALKLASSSWPATTLTYLILMALGWVAYVQW